MKSQGSVLADLPSMSNRRRSNAATERQCPSCLRKSALTRVAEDGGDRWHVVTLCRWCGWNRISTTTAKADYAPSAEVPPSP